MSGLIAPLTVGSPGRCRYRLRRTVRLSLLSILIHFLLAVLVTTGVRVSDSEADPQKHDVEHLVFEDCGTARMMIGHLPPAELEKSLITLVSTIRLGIRGAGYAVTGPRPLAGTGITRIPGHGELSGDIVLMSLDPGRNERARRCSIELLRSFLPARPLAMRELIALADDPDIVGADRALAEEIRGIVVSVSEEVAAAMSPGEVILLIEPLVREQPGIVVSHWQPLLRLFMGDALNLLSRKYLTSPEFDGTLLDVLSALDPSGESSSRLIENAFLTLDDESRKLRVLAWMRRVPLPRDRMISLLLLELIRGSVRNTLAVLRVMAASLPIEACRARVDLDEFVLSNVFEAVSSWGVVMEEGIRTGKPVIACAQQCREDSGETGLEALWCDRRLFPQYQRIIDELVGSDSYVLGTSWSAIATLPFEHAELEGYLRQSLNSAHRSVRLAAFSIYSKQPLDRGKFVSDALRLLKRPAVLADEKRKIVELLARSFLSPPIGIQGLPALPLLLDYFESPSPECGVLCAENGGRAPLITQAIGAVGKDAFPLLVRSLESNKNQRRRLALLALGSLSPVDQRMAYFLVGGLRDSDSNIRELSEQLVFRRREEVAVRNELTKALKWSDADAVGRVAALLRRE